jgi:HEAT repeat protein
MKTIYCKSLFFVLMLLLLSASVKAASGQINDSNLLNKSPSELIELWENASHTDKEVIVERLFENIPETIPVVRNKILNGTTNQRLFACAMVAEIGDTNSVPTLIQAIDDSEIKIKVRAISSLGKMRATKALLKIRQEMKDTQNKTVLKAAIAAMGSLGKSQDIPSLRVHLTNPDESVRVNAAAALALLGSNEGLEILLEGSLSPNQAVRKEATYSLGFVNTTASRNRLQEIFNDPNGQWKSYAQIAMSQQDLMAKNATQQLKVLEGLVTDENPRVAEWAVEKIAEIDVPQAGAILKDVEKNKTGAGKKASRLLKVREGK